MSRRKWMDHLTGRLVEIDPGEYTYLDLEYGETTITRGVRKGDWGGEVPVWETRLPDAHPDRHHVGVLKFDSLRQAVMELERACSEDSW